MKTTRIPALLLAVLLCLPLFSACHSARELHAFEVPDFFDTEKKHEITFWAKNDTNVVQDGIYKQAIERFETLYPNVKVHMKPYTNYGDIYNDVLTNISTSTTPNVCISYPDHIATYLKGENTVVPLDALYSDGKYGLGGSALLFDGPTLDEIIPKFLEEGKVNGGYYAIPFMRSTEACYVNKGLVEKLGFTLPETLTWDFIFEVSLAATEKDEAGNYKINGQKTMIPFIYKSTDNMMIQMLKQLEEGYSTDDGRVLIFNDKTKELLDMLVEPVEKGAFSTFKISSYPGNYFNAGQCIFAIDSTAGATWIGADAPLSEIDESKKQDFETVVLPIPQFDTERPKMISQGPSLCIFNKEDPQEVLASWLFAQYLLTNEVQIAYAQTEGYVPVTEKAQKSPEYTDYLARAGEDNDLYYDVKLDATKLLLENTENTFVTPVFDGSASLRNAAGQMIEAVVKSVMRKEKIDAAYYEKLYGEMISLYKLDSFAGTKQALGPMPMTSKLLLAGLSVIWCGILGYIFIEKVKNSKKRT